MKFNMLPQELFQKLSKASHQEPVGGQAGSRWPTSANPATVELWRIAETANTDRLESILASGADINEANPHGVTALMRAVSLGNVKMVRALLFHGAEPNTSRNDHFTPLLLAAFFGHEEIVRLLVEAGADTKAHSRFETSAQMWASARTFTNVVEYLKTPLKNVDAPPPTAQNIHSLQPQLETHVRQLPVETIEPWEVIDLAAENETEIPELPLQSQPVSWVPALAHRSLVFAPAALLLVLAITGLILTLKNRGGETSPISMSNTTTPSTVVNVPPPTTIIDTDNSAFAVEPGANVTAETTPSKPQLKDESNHFTNAPKPKVLKSGIARNDDQSVDPQSTKPTAATERLQVAPPISEPAAKRDSPVVTKTADTAAASRPNVQTAVPAPLTPQLLTPVPNSSTKARVIRWP